MVPYGPGGGFDVLSRAIGREMPKYLPREQDIIIQNVIGAGGRRGTGYVYRSEPDGYTIGILNVVGLVAGDLVKPATEYDLGKFAWLGQLSSNSYVLMVAADSPIQTIEDLRQEEDLVFGHHGSGATDWLVTKVAKGVLDLPQMRDYVSATKVPEIVVRILAGDVDAVFIQFGSLVMQYTEAGDLKPILIAGLEAIPELPGVPTLQGTPYEELSSVAAKRAVAGPPGLPSEIAEILEEALRQTILEDEAFKKWAEEAQMPVAWASADETANMVSSIQQTLKEYEALLQE